MIADFLILAPMSLVSWALIKGAFWWARRQEQ